MPSNRHLKNLVRRRQRARLSASSGARSVPSAPGAEETSSLASEPLDPAGAEQLGDEDIISPHDDVEPESSFNYPVAPAMVPPTITEAADVETASTEADEATCSVFPSRQSRFFEESGTASEPQLSLPFLDLTVTEEDDWHDAVISIPETPRLIP